MRTACALALILVVIQCGSTARSASPPQPPATTGRSDANRPGPGKARPNSMEIQTRRLQQTLRSMQAQYGKTILALRVAENGRAHAHSRAERGQWDELVRGLHRSLANYHRMAELMRQTIAISQSLERSRRTSAAGASGHLAPDIPPPKAADRTRETPRPDQNGSGTTNYVRERVYFTDPYAVSRSGRG